MALEDALSHITDPDEREAMLSILRVEVDRRRRRAALLAALNVQAALEATKRCPSCETTKPVSAFGKNAARPDGLQSQCRPCRRRVNGT